MNMKSCFILNGIMEKTYKEFSNTLFFQIYKKNLVSKTTLDADQSVKLCLITIFIIAL